MGYLAGLKKKVHLQFDQASQKVRLTYLAFKQDPTEANRKKWIEERQVFEHCAKERELLRSSEFEAKLFKFGNKSGRLLANLAKGQRQPQYINSLKNSAGKIVHDPARINSILGEYYEHLYKDGGKVDLSDTLLDKVGLPKMTEEQRSALNAEITETELQGVIKGLGNSKAPGPDALTVLIMGKLNKERGGEVSQMIKTKKAHGDLDKYRYKKTASPAVRGKMAAAEDHVAALDIDSDDASSCAPSELPDESDPAPITRAFLQHSLQQSLAQALSPVLSELAVIRTELHQFLKTVYFTNTAGEDVHFDEHGDAAPKYDLINWKPPRSVCSESCPPGTRKMMLQEKPVCCYDCVPCPRGEVTNHADMISCWKCPYDQWPNEKNNKCTEKQMAYLSYKELLGMTLACSAVLLSLVSLITLAVFNYYQNSSVIKATNKILSLLLLLSLTVTFCSCLVFIGYPRNITCLLRQTIFGMSFTVSVSSLLAKTILVVVAFRATKPGSQLRRFMGQKLPCSIVSLCSSLQAVICALWLGTCPPTPFFDLNSQPGEIVIVCEEHLGFYVMLAYIGCLALGCTVIAFPARKLPDRYNEAKFITFSMLVFFSAWITFIPAYLSTKGKYTVAVEVFAILVSAAGVLFCIFFPKCYILFCTPEKTKMAAIKCHRLSTQCSIKRLV
ncbi:vomeronasal type-2 receptor 26-like [Bufo gargarizans]|uniref:vomeronasal type-2 receptor 26-like n=1 Tax=Bufo gargarizans TaxID=30331 RepID=UPI001CF3842C|nr:vomeronasal type-2 receptor 26-like [Bufo gargarizans]